MGNQTTWYVLVLSGVTDLPNLQPPLLLVFLLVYLMTLIVNLLILFLVSTDSHLQTPMYFFLGTLACLDMSSSSVTVPRMLFDLHTNQKIISLQACLTQIYFFLFIAMSEVLLLAVMSCDRCIAICRPLHYMQIMDQKTCVRLVSGTLISGMVYSLVHILSLLKLTFCGLNTLQSFLCDLPQLLQVSCSDVFANKLLILFLVVFLGVCVLFMNVYPYIIILKTIIKIQSKHMRYKAFSTCSSHLTVIFIFYVTGFFNYLETKTNHHFADSSRMSSVFYAVLTPLLNPIIYSLRNQELKTSFKRVLNRF
ncbi:hypothetical protein GDO86_017417 [Hymenochirus boettgeri]|uniref:Olfactory receptor n=1 Tax=Hymenochirus boettgeri TaxID=247094 RepID=A0A8T2IQD6_9PIPI|nr:hypothetical protein GDO86_017417 [Hymenochirus boettgeri]